MPLEPVAVGRFRQQLSPADLPIVEPLRHLPGWSLPVLLCSQLARMVAAPSRLNAICILVASTKRASSKNRGVGHTRTESNTKLSGRSLCSPYVGIWPSGQFRNLTIGCFLSCVSC